MATVARVFLLSALLGACSSTEAPPAAPQAAAPQVAWTASPGLVWSAEALWAERALLRGAEDASALGEARHALSEVVDRSPYRTYDLHLAAYVERLAGDAAAEQAILSRVDPDRASVYDYFFTRPIAPRTTRPLNRSPGSATARIAWPSGPVGWTLLRSLSS